MQSEIFHTSHAAGAAATAAAGSVGMGMAQKKGAMSVSEGAFNFDLYRRNGALLSGAPAAAGAPPAAADPHAHAQAEQASNVSEAVKSIRPMSTGTTICGVVFDGGIVLGADTRATGGAEVADKNCEKIHYLAPNIYCCGAGTAADTEKTTELIASRLLLLRQSMGGKYASRVVTACTMLKRMLFRYQGHISAALVLGGVDATGPHLFSIFPHGSTQKNPYITMGSGSLAAMSVMESRFQEDMDEGTAVELVRDAILAGIYNDLGSGSNCDITIIRSVPGAARGTTEVEKRRGFLTPNDVSEVRARMTRPERLNVPAGATAVLSEVRETFQSRVVVEEGQAEAL